VSGEEFLVAIVRGRFRLEEQDGRWR
jgi:hypothetical protein